MEISEGVIRRRPNTLADLLNSSDDSQPHFFFFFWGGGVGGGGKLGGGRNYILTLQSKNYIKMDPLNSFALSFKVYNFLTYLITLLLFCFFCFFCFLGGGGWGGTLGEGEKNDLYTNASV